MGQVLWMNGFNTALDVCSAIVAIVIWLNFFIQKDSTSIKLSRILTVSAACFSMSAFADAGTWYFLEESNSLIFKLCLAVDYILFQMVAASLHMYMVKQFEDIFLTPKFFAYIGYAVVAVMGVLWLASYKLGIFFRFTANGYEHTEIFALSWSPTILVFIIDFVLLVLNFLKLEARDVYVFASYIMIGIMGCLLEHYLNTPALYVAFVMILLLLYINIDMHKTKTIAEQQNRIEEGQALLALSQIKPHFIYNCLNVIQVLCTTDPELAQTATHRFSCFLRGYIDAMDKVEMIPLEDELYIVENYIYLERLRFGERLQLQMDIENEDFFVPALSVEPLVENAIKYGILRKPEGGTVSIHAYDTLDEHIVEIKDDGVGIDSDWRTQKMEKRSHVGMKNVESRLTKLCMGYLQVESESGMGTKISIHIPNVKGKKNVK